MAELRTTRNFGIAAHIDAGKTTVTERMLYYTGKIYRMGEVHDGTATMDFLEDEQKRGITIQSAATTCFWDRRKEKFTLNLIDTPGHVDFTMEVERSMRVLDGAVTVFDGKEGVEAQSETVWRQADRYNVPRICFINKMDKLVADFKYSFDSLYSRLGINAVAVQIPIGAGNTFDGIIDLIKMKAYHFGMLKEGSTITEFDIPDDLIDEAEYWRHELVEKISEVDEELFDKYCHDEEITQSSLRWAIRRATIKLKCFPVFCGSALKYIGVRRLIDGVIDYLPAPNEVPDIEGTHPRNPDKVITRPHEADAPFSALVFKVVNDVHGDLTYTRIYSGTLRRGSRVLNSNNGKKENISRIYEMHAKDRQARDVCQAGDIVALIGVKNTVTGETLCASDHPIVLERMEFPDPVISMSIEPVTAGDRDKLAHTLATLHREDPSFYYTYNNETGETVMAGMGELHLDIIQTKISRDLGIPIRVGKPRVAYCETIAGIGEGRGIHKKQTGGRGQFADVKLTVEPFTKEQAKEAKIDFTDDIAFEDKIVGGAIPKEFIGSVESGARRTAMSGVLAGYPMHGIKIALIDGAFHEVDSSTVAFEVAGILAFKKACNDAGLILLEPIMKIVITTPEDFLGAVTGDISSRRGIITGQERKGNAVVITAAAPLSEMFGYATALRGVTQGRANYAMEPDTYKAVPTNIADNILAGVAI